MRPHPDPGLTRDEVSEAIAHAWQSVLTARDQGDHDRALLLMTRVDDLLDTYRRTTYRR